MNRHPSHHRHVRALTALILGAIAGATIALGTADDTPPTPTVVVTVPVPDTTPGGLDGQ